jgi:hypothetical protein
MNTGWHFPIMILFSLLIFFIVIRWVIGDDAFRTNKKKIIILSLVVVVAGMLMGKYGAQFLLPWWIYYPVPMLLTVFLPPLVLKMNKNKTILYLVLSFLSAPFIHFVFSFFLGWKEYMPFWDIPSLSAIIK